MRVLHIISLIGENGESGGPIKVARELKERSGSSLFKISIIGAIKKQAPNGENIQSDEIRILANPLLKRFPISTLYSTELLFKILDNIRNSKMVHLHFGREIVQIWSSFCCIFFNKKFVLQTHGMVRQKKGLFWKIFDFLFILPILKRASKILVLTKYEENELRKIFDHDKYVLLPNGISFSTNLVERLSEVKYRIVFISRLHNSKGVNTFLDLAKRYCNDSLIDFEIYGPDQGELPLIQNFLRNNKMRNLKYLGPVATSKVSTLLSQSDLLILPSIYDPYPMIVLEALAVGTPVIVSPVCGNSSFVSKINVDYVAKSVNYSSFVENFERLRIRKFDQSQRRIISAKASELFDINFTWTQLENIYESVLSEKRK